jgi:hypothetical protein
MQRKQKKNKKYLKKDGDTNQYDEESKRNIDNYQADPG